jgi:hypothetical protein
MRTLISLSFALIVATGCSKKSGDYQAACEHMIELAKADIEANIQKMGPDMASFGKELREKAEATTKSDLETCISKSKEREVDASCILDAKTIDEVGPCLQK